MPTECEWMVQWGLWSSVLEELWCLCSSTRYPTEFIFGPGRVRNRGGFVFLGAPDTGIHCLLLRNKLPQNLVAWIKIYYEVLRAKHLSDSSRGFVVGYSQDVGWGPSHLKVWLVLKDMFPRSLSHITVSRCLQFLTGCWQETSLFPLHFSIGLLEISHNIGSWLLEHPFLVGTVLPPGGWKLVPEVESKTSQIFQWFVAFQRVVIPKRCTVYLWEFPSWHSG